MPKTAVYSAQKTPSPLSVTAETANGLSFQTTDETETDATHLLVPTSYEQYLTLTDPSDVAVTEDYTAIADENAIYVYDRADGIYRKYLHEVNGTPEKNKVTKLQFDDADNLYFIDASTYLYRIVSTALDDEQLTATETGFVCSTFVINGDELFFATTSGNESQISKTPLSDLRVSSATTLYQFKSTTPSLAVWNEELYYTDNGKYLNKLHPDPKMVDKEAPTFVTAFQTELFSLAIADNTLFCSTTEGELFVYDLLALADEKQASNVTPILSDTDGYAAISIFDGAAYVIKNNAIRQYSLEKSAFTGYEIGSASSSINRLNGGSDVCLSDGLLFIADLGNNRVSVYDTKAQTFKTPITTALPPSRVASDGNTLLVAGDATVALYDLSENNYGAQLVFENDFDGKLVGIASVYGDYYLVTDANVFYALRKTEPDADGNKPAVWGWQQTRKSSTRYPSLLTADAYGNLYVVCGNDAYLYTEETFLASATSDTLVCSALPARTKKIAVDYRGNLYALSENTVYRFNADETAANRASEASATYALNDPLVYGVEPTATSFAFGIEENATYVLYAENYLTETNKLGLPTVKTIPVNGADESIFSAESAEFTVVRTAPDSLIVEFDMNKLQGAEVFPYLSYERCPQEKTALKIGETDVYDLLAVYDESARSYSTYLVASDSCAALPTDDYRIEYAEEDRQTGYLSNAIALYKFPYLTRLLTVCEMPRGALVTLTGEIDRLDHAYYQISYVDEKGKTQTGYIPKSYVTPVSGSTAPETNVYGGEDDNADDIWRMVYIILGFGAICILVDYLILRKPKD